ncbi:unnamed protein product (mitochondrion) [Plasmodiophora brassicae]|uniref:Sugar phosphate transporter domain-containing protein n=1 Tax=Plasmodiophora brassicae TaxID=37360 RepID=A0A3P3YKT1_PLABS|nr:unnamed protein product [Plasmodiophora brassicae]
MADLTARVASPAPASARQAPVKAQQQQQQQQPDAAAAGANAPAGEPAANASFSSLFGLIICWYTSSIVAAKLNYVLMHELGGPVRLSLFQQTFVSVAGMIVLAVYDETTDRPANVTRRHQLDAVVPLSVTMTVMSIAYNAAMEYIPVSFLNTIKATIPFWTCIVCWLIQGQQYALTTRLSLLPIVGGVALASANEVGFHPVGFGLGVVSAFNQTFFNIRAKRILIRRLMTSMQLQVYTAILSTGFLAIALGVSYTTSSTGGDAMEPGSELRSTPFFLMLIVGLNYFGELRLSYVAINMLGSLGYSVADVFRRLIVIVSAVLLFGNTIQPLNIVGVCIAMFGILLYNLSILSAAKSAAPVPAWAKKTKGDPHAA